MSRRLILGTVRRSRGRGPCLLGVVGGRQIFSIAGAEDDGSDSADDYSSEGDDTDSDGDENDDDDSDDKPAAKNKRRSASTRAHSETRAMRRELNQLKREKAEREKADREAELQGKTDAERATAERDDALKALGELRPRYQEAMVELEIVRASGKKYAWNDIDDVLNDRTLRKQIEINDDGEVTGVEEALKDLAKRKPHFLAKAAEDDGKGGKGKGGAGGSNGGAGNGQSGVNTNGSGGDKGRQADRERLNAIYPAVARLPQ